MRDESSTENFFALEIGQCAHERISSRGYFLKACGHNIASEEYFIILLKMVLFGSKSRSNMFTNGQRTGHSEAFLEFGRRQAIRRFSLEYFSQRVRQCAIRSVFLEFSSRMARWWCAIRGVFACI